VDADNIEDGRASVDAEEMEMFDFFNIPNALFRLMSPVSQEATVSFDLDFVGPVSNSFTLTNNQHRFTGDFFTTLARMEWSATRADGFTFESYGKDTSISTFAEVGRVHNGAFFG
jgi:hypothetical protein